MDTSTRYPTYLDLNGHTLTNTGTFDVNAGSEYAYLNNSSGTFDNEGMVNLAGTLDSNSASFTNNGVTDVAHEWVDAIGFLYSRCRRCHKLRP